MRQITRLDNKKDVEKEDSESFYELLDVIDFRDDLRYK